MPATQVQQNILPEHSPVPVLTHNNNSLFKTGNPYSKVKLAAIGGAAAASTATMLAGEVTAQPEVVALTPVAWALGGLAGGVTAEGVYLVDAGLEFQDLSHAKAVSFQPSSEFKHIISAQHILAKQLKAAGVPIDANGKIINFSEYLETIQKVIKQGIEEQNHLIHHDHNKDKREDAKLTKKILEAAQAEAPEYRTKIALLEAAQTEKQTLQASGVMPTAEGTANVTAQGINLKKKGR